MTPSTTLPGRLAPGLRWLTVAAAVALATGCASHYGAAHIRSVPAGAEVVSLEDDTVLGLTPVKVWWKDTAEDRKFINVRFTKEGYRDKTSAFWVNMRHRSKGAALNEPQQVNVELEQLEEATQ